MNESIFKTAFRRFFVVLATVTASLLAILLAFMLIGTMSSFFLDKDLSQAEIPSAYSTEIQPNANGERKVLAKTSPVILKLNIDGIIGTEKLNRQKIEKMLVESRESPLTNNRVKGILIAMNSPGGSATDSDTIYHALKSYKEHYKVPIYVHVDGLCASGGMYIACAADKIYATDASLVGSIGVVTPPIFNFSDLMTKVGVESKTLLAGKGKDELNPFRPWTKGEGQNYQLAIDYFYNLFLNVVTTNRKEVDKEKLINDYGADIFPALKAQEIGLIDSNNITYNEALRLLTKELGLKEDEYQVIGFKEDNWLTSLLKSQNSTLLTGTVTHRLQYPGQLDDRLVNQFLYLYQYGQ